MSSVDVRGAVAPVPPAVAGGTRFPRARAAGRQFAGAIATLLVISIVTFSATNISGPTAVARAALGRGTTPGQLQAYVKAHHLDRPLVVRYGSWLEAFVRGDWGTSSITNRPVRADVIPKFEKTLLLSLVALAMALPLSLLMGVFMARRHGQGPDITMLVGTVIVAALPEFVVGIGLIMLFAVQLRWLPVDSTALSFGTFEEKAQAFILPAVTLSLAMVPYIARIARGSAVEALSEPYTQAAVLRGLSRRAVIWDHAMRNAAAPLINAVALNLVYLLSGVIVVENVFAFPGIGSDLVQAIDQKDSITVQAIALVIGAMFIVISLAADLLVVYFNPRLRSSS